MDELQICSSPRAPGAVWSRLAPAFADGRKRWRSPCSTRCIKDSAVLRPAGARRSGRGFDAADPEQRRSQVEVLEEALAGHGVVKVALGLDADQRDVPGRATLPGLDAEVGQVPEVV